MSEGGRESVIWMNIFAKAFSGRSICLCVCPLLILPYLLYFAHVFFLERIEDEGNWHLGVLGGGHEGGGMKTRTPRKEEGQAGREVARTVRSPALMVLYFLCIISSQRECELLMR